MSPAVKFRQCFSQKNLRRIFNDNVSLSGVRGKDGISPEQFRRNLDDEVKLIHKKVLDGSYFFTPYKERLVSKGKGKSPRVLSIPTVRDRVVLRALCEFYTDVFSEAITRPPNWHVRRFSEALKSAPLDNHVVRLDVVKFYDSCDHEIILEALKEKIRKKEIITLTRRLLKTPTTIKKEVGAINEIGIPQGLSVSNILSGIYMRRFDVMFYSAYSGERYVDDIILISGNERQASADFEYITNKLLDDFKLKIHSLSEEGKSSISKIDKGADFLGYRLTRSSISVRSSSYKKFISSLESIVTRYRYKRDDFWLVWKINLRITGCISEGKPYGWVRFFQLIDDGRLLKRIDDFVSRRLRSVGGAHLLKSIKSLHKVHYEICFRSFETTYVPNFDEWSTDEMRDLLVSLKVISSKVERSMTDRSIKNLFFRRIRKEVSELDEDVSDIS